MSNSRRWSATANFRRLTTMTKQYRSDALASIHETMEALHEVGAIDNQTMREFDDSCLTPVEPLSPAAIRALREREHLSQPVFARYLKSAPAARRFDLSSRPT